MDFYSRIGVMALGSRLRRLGDRMAEDAAQIYKLYGNEIQPRWFPVLYVLSEREEQSVTAIAEEIGHSHVSVSQIVKEMLQSGYVRLKKQKSDGRKTFVALSRKGQTALASMKDQYADVREAVQNLQSEAGVDLWQALAACEDRLSRESLYDRVQREKKKRQSADIRIVDYSPRYAQAFKALNEQWIKTYFELEDADRRSLNNPQQSILKSGGHILIALLKDTPIGTCALIEHGSDCLELAKMAVAPQARGKGIGWLIGQAAVQRARDAGAKRIYLESNTVLKPAIRLYYKLGFQKIKGEPSPYKRCNIQMEMRLD